MFWVIWNHKRFGRLKNSPYLRGMKMIQDPKIKIYKKLFSKLTLHPSGKNFRGSFKITHVRKYRRWDIETHPLYHDIYNYEFDVEINGEIYAWMDNHMSWWSSEIQKHNDFSRRKFNDILRSRFLVKDVSRYAKLVGISGDFWSIQVKNIKWVWAPCQSELTWLYC